MLTTVPEMEEDTDELLLPAPVLLPATAQPKKATPSERKRIAAMEEVRGLVGEFQSERLRALVGKNKLQRPILAIVADCYPRKVLELAFEIQISGREYTKSQIHARWPGALHPVPEIETHRLRVKGDNIVALLDCLSTGGKLQRTAFGVKVVEILGGQDYVTIENIERNMKIRKIAAEFVLSLCDESEQIVAGVVEEGTVRCQKLERDTFRRCLCHGNHDGRCKFVAPGSMSAMTKAAELVKLFTGNDIKKLSGLDDIKTEKG